MWATEIPEAAWMLAAAFWPGPLTMVLPAALSVSPVVTGGQSTVALRVPAHPVFQSVLRQFGQGLAAPSANLFGQTSPTTAAHVRNSLNGRIAAVVDGGPCPVGIESTIVDLSSDHPRILRPGMITAEAIAKHLPRIGTTSTPAPRVPGMLESHYMPRKPCFRVPSDLNQEPFPGQRHGLLATHPVNWPVARFWPMPAHPEDYARVLYSTLHEADASDCDVLLIANPPDEPSWVGINDRICRATQSLGGYPL